MPRWNAPSENTKQRSVGEGDPLYGQIWSIIAREPRFLREGPRLECIYILRTVTQSA